MTKTEQLQNNINKYLNKKFINNNNGEYFTVIDYINAKNLTIIFEDGTIKNNVFSGHIKDGKIKNPNINKLSNTIIPSVFNIGYIGIGKWNSKNAYNLYIIWYSMFKRCYSKNNYQSYINCSVAERWHNFQNFAEWCEKNYIDGFQLDKDILIKGNKIYSEETCCFVSSEINKLFLKGDIKRGQYPIGVSYYTINNKYSSMLSINGIEKHLGYYKTPEEAFKVYKKSKEEYIKEIADKYKNEISEKVYQALYNYIVEITD